MWPGIPILLKITRLLFVCNMLRKKWVMKLIFPMKVPYKLILIFYRDNQTFPKYQACNVFTIYLKATEMKLIFARRWKSKFPTNWYYFYWWEWSSILKALKSRSLNYLYNISKRKGVYLLHLDKHRSFNKLALFWRKWSDKSNVSKIGIL